jgi:hypothetical protein
VTRLDVRFVHREPHAHLRHLRVRFDEGAPDRADGGAGACLAHGFATDLLAQHGE